MKRRQRKDFSLAVRILSVILLIVIMVTTNTLSICAVSDQIKEAVAYSIASNYSPSSADAVAIEVGLSADDAAGDMAAAEGDPAKPSSSDDGKRLIYRYAPMDAEAQLRDLCEDFAQFSLCPVDKRYVLWDFLALEQERLDETATEFVRLESMGYDLYHSALILQATMEGLFTVDEAIAICALYPQTAWRMTELYRFAVYSAELLPADEAAEVQTVSTVSGGTYAEAKAYFLEGYPTRNIKAAFYVGGKLGVSPAALITRENSTVLAETADSSALKTLLTVYPVDPSGLSLSLSASSALSAGQSVEQALVDRVFENTTESSTSISTSSVTTDSGTTETPIWTRDMSAPFMVSLTDMGNVSLATGSAYYTDNLLSIPGRAGFDLDLNLVYHSADSNLTKPELYEQWEEIGYIYEIYLVETCIDENGNQVYCEYYFVEGPYDDEYYAQCQLTFYESSYEVQSDGSIIYYDYCVEQGYNPVFLGLSVNMLTNSGAEQLAAGWSWEMPELDMLRVEQEGGTVVLTPGYVTIPDIGSFTLTYAESSAGGKVWTAHRDCYSYSSSASGGTFAEQSTFSNGSVNSAYAFSFLSTGHVCYFDVNGNFIGERDAHGNVIKYIYNANNQLIRILDTANRQIDLTYVDSGSTRTITIALPDQNTIIFTLTKQNDTIYSLSKIRKQNGTEYNFGYTSAASSAVYKSECDTGDGYEELSAEGTITYILLKEVRFPTGAKLSYTYTSTTEECSNMTQQLYRVTQTVITDAANSVLQRQRITYTGSYIAQGTNGNIATVKYDDGSKQVYEYNVSNLLSSCTDYTAGGSVWKKTTYSYFAAGLPSQISTVCYGQSLSSVETWEYYSSGALKKYTSPTGETTIYAVNTWLPYQPRTSQSSAGSIYYIVQSGSYTLTGRAVYLGSYDQSYPMGAYADTYVAYSYDAYGNRTAERQYTEMPTEDIDSTGVYLQTYQYVYGACAGNTTSSLYLTAVKQDGVVTESYTYDIMGRKTSVTDGTGNTTYTTYDCMGRVLTVTYPDGGVERYTYEDTANTVVHTTLSGGAVKYAYDATGRLLTVTRLTDNTVVAAYAYDTRDRMIEEKNAQNLDSTAKIIYTYDRADDYATKKVYDGGGTLVYSETVTWSAGTRLSAVNGLGGETSYTQTTYDKYGRVTRKMTYTTSTAYARTNAYTYDTRGNVTRVQSNSPDQPTQINYQYDYLNRLISTTDALGNTATVTYDVLGNRIAERSFDGVTTTYTYNTRGRVIAQSTPFNGTTVTQKQYTYDNANRVTLEKQSSNADNSTAVTWKTTAYAYDSMGRVTDIYLPAKQVGASHTHYEYDVAGNLTKAYTGALTSVTSPDYSGYAVVRYTYDSYGQQTAVIDGLGLSDTYLYDANGNLIIESTRDGRIIAYTYDALGRETVRIVSIDGIIQSMQTTSYDGVGRVVSVSRDGYTISNTYAHNNLTQVSESDGSVKTYTYDTAGLCTGYTLTVDGTAKDSATYAYNAMRRLTSVATGGYTVSYSYDAAGRRIRETVGDERDLEYTYNTAGLLTYVYNHIPDYNEEEGMELSYSESYAYNTDGTQRYKNENGVIASYTYDTLGRLIGETGSAATISYSYDARGNRTSMSKNGVSTTYTYNNANQLLTETSQGVTKTYSYDDAGNLTTVANGAIILQSYTYNAWGEQIGYTAPQELITASYTYGPDGLRRSKTVNSTTTEFVWNGDKMVYAATSSGETVYCYAASLLSSYDGTATYTYFLNAHGDVTQLRAGETIVKTYTYDAFGNEIGINTADTNPFRYAGQYYDKEEGKYYLRARHYDPATGRFTQQDGWTFADAKQPLSWNLYAYCWNDPVQYVDPSGNVVITATAATAIVVVSLISLGILYFSDEIVEMAESVVDIGADLLDVVEDRDEWWNQSGSQVAVASYKPGKKTQISLLVDFNVERFDPRAPRIHHVVAQKDRRADEARAILDDVKITVHDPINLVIIPHGTHKGMHTNSYYLYVNKRLTSAISSSNAKIYSDPRSDVEATLAELQFEIIMYCNTGIAPWIVIK